MIPCSMMNSSEISVDLIHRPILVGEWNFVGYHDFLASFSTLNALKQQYVVR